MLCSLLIVLAQEKIEATPEADVVWGRTIDLVGAAELAAKGIVGYEDLTNRPVLRVGELVDVIPGMIATQHSGNAIQPFFV